MEKCFSVEKTSQITFGSRQQLTSQRLRSLVLIRLWPVSNTPSGRYDVTWSCINDLRTFSNLVSNTGLCVVEQTIATDQPSCVACEVDYTKFLMEPIFSKSAPLNLYKCHKNVYNLYQFKTNTKVLSVRKDGQIKSNSQLPNLHYTYMF